MTQPVVVENFATNTGQFQVIGLGSHGPSSFVFAGGQGTFTNSGSGRDSTVAYDTNMPVAAGPSIFVYVNIGTPPIPFPSAGTYANICAGIFHDAGNALMIEVGGTSNPAIFGVDILLFALGTQYNFTAGSPLSTATPPDAVGMSLEGNIASTFVRYGPTWQFLGSVDVSSHVDFTAPGALVGWYAGSGVNTDAGGSIAISELWSGPPIPQCDNNFGDVVLLLDCDGTNGSTTFTDLSPVGNVMSVDFGGSAGPPTVSTTSPKFGTGCASFNAGGIGTGGAGRGVLYTPITMGGPLDLTAASLWTIEGWVYIPSTGNTGFTQTVMTYGSGPLTNGGTANGVTLEMAGDGTLSAHFYGTASIHINAGAYVGDAWNHFAIVNNSGNASLYIGGAATDSPQPLSSVGQYVGYLNFGGDYNFSVPFFVNGFRNQFDEIRVTKGVARYTANFTPPIAAFPTIACVSTVPSVVGLDDATAQADIMAAFYLVGTVTHVANTAAPNSVISQTPAGGTSASVGTSVNLVESLGALVPNVVNTSATLIAPGIITGAGFVVGTITYASDVLTIPGNVSSQTPAAGSFAVGGSPVNLVVSTGRAGLLVPLILFLTEQQAIDALVSIGLVPGGISFAPSTTFAAGEVMSQNPSAGNPVAYGSIVGFVVSTGTPIVSEIFDTTPTVISQYANSPTLLQWIENMNLYLDQSVNFAQFLAYVWNVNTAVGFGLNILGRIVNVSRLLQIPNTTPYVGFDNGTRTPSDWEPLGSNLPGGGGIGALYSGHNATQAYLLDDDAYRQLILAKAFANICSTTAPAINRILQNLYGDNNAWVLNTGAMSISYNFRFRPSPIQLAILQQSGVIPTPPGVSVTIVSP